MSNIPISGEKFILQKVKVVIFYQSSKQISILEVARQKWWAISLF